MKEDRRLICIVMFLLATICFAETNWNLQAVDGSGVGTHPSIPGGYKVTVEGYILNRPEYMLNGEPNYNAIPEDAGGQWQIFIQGGQGDHAGTAVWMAQNYQNLFYAGGIGRYTNEQWLVELDRMNHDPRTGHRFMPGDKVRVTGLTKFYGGKTNINERHNTDPDNDITIELIELGAGLPEPEVITLNMVKDINDNFIFNHTRQTGGEYYQSRLVRINGVHFVSDANWGPNGELIITDGTRTLPLWLGIGPGITVGSNNLDAQFDVIGIFNQENSNTAGYLVWVTNYDGNGQILADGCDLYGVFAPGDINKDCVVNFEDFAIMAADWLKCTNSLLTDCQ